MNRTDQVLFDADMELLFDTLLEKMRQGRISPERAEQFFPQEVRDRNALENLPSEDVT